MSISNFSNYIVISGKGIAICKAILVSPSTMLLICGNLPACTSDVQTAWPCKLGYVHPIEPVWAQKMPISS